MSEPVRCPQCAGPVEKLRYPGGYLNPDQWDFVRAGDYLCRACPPNDRSGANKYCYWWEKEVVKPAKSGREPCQHQFSIYSRQGTQCAFCGEYEDDVILNSLETRLVAAQERIAALEGALRLVGVRVENAMFVWVGRKEEILSVILEVLEGEKR